MHPWLPDEIRERKLVRRGGPQGLHVSLGRHVHGPQDAHVAGFGLWRQWVLLLGVLGQVEEEWRPVVGDKVAVAQADVGGEAAVGTLGAEFWGEEEDLPHGGTCGGTERVA